MSEKLPQEILDYHLLQAEIADIELEASQMAETIVQKYCPFKKGEKVYYWTSIYPEKRQSGIIARISFRGVNSDAYDNKWLIWIAPRNNDFTEPRRKLDYIKIGRMGGKERIEKA